MRLDDLFQCRVVHTGLARVSIQPFSLERLEGVLRARRPRRVERIVDGDGHGVGHSFVIRLKEVAKDLIARRCSESLVRCKDLKLYDIYCE